MPVAGRTLATLTVLSLLGTLAAGVPSASALPATGKVAALDLGDGMLTISMGLLMPPCPAAVCFEVLTPAAFSTATLSDYNAIIVGWDETTDGSMHAALAARVGDIAGYVTTGGGFIVLSQYQSGDYTYVPGGGAITSVSTHAEDVTVTPAGALHPSLNGMTSAQLSNWGNSRHSYFTGGVPGYFTHVADSVDGPVSYAGNYGEGCVFITGQDPDWHFANGVADAGVLLDNVLTWSMACPGGIDPPVPELPTLGLLAVGLVGIGGLVALRRR